MLIYFFSCSCSLVFLLVFFFLFSNTHHSDKGYTPKQANATCGTNSQFTEIICTPVACSATQVKNSKLSVDGSIHGSFGDSAIVVYCLDGYEGGGIIQCSSNGKFNLLTCTASNGVVDSNSAVGSDASLAASDASSGSGENTESGLVAADASADEVAASSTATGILGTTTGLLAVFIGVLFLLVFLQRRTINNKQAALDKLRANAAAQIEMTQEVQLTNSNPMNTSDPTCTKVTLSMEEKKQSGDDDGDGEIGKVTIEMAEMMAEIVGSPIPSGSPIRIQDITVALPSPSKKKSLSGKKVGDDDAGSVVSMPSVMHFEDVQLTNSNPLDNTSINV